VILYANSLQSASFFMAMSVWLPISSRLKNQSFVQKIPAVLKRHPATVPPICAALPGLSSALAPGSGEMRSVVLFLRGRR